MMVMGFMISLSGLISIAVAYLLRIFINRTGNTADVGLYNAGFAIINTYVGMIFTAMGTDYYPRLSAVANSNELCSRNVNQQSEIALLILAPVLIGFLVFIHWAIILLYSTQFLDITGMIYWASLGIFFKAVSWAIAFVFLAKGASRLFFWNELAGNTYTLGFSLLGYHLEINGTGHCIMVVYMIYMVQVYIIAKMKYQFSFTTSFIKIFAIQLTLALISFAVVNLIEKPLAYLIGTALIGFSCWYSYVELESRIGLREIVQGFIQKGKKNKEL